MTQAEAGIRGTKAVRLLGRLVYELISGQAPSFRANQRPSPLPQNQVVLVEPRLHTGRPQTAE
jgi:hypothetical protein